MTVVVRETSETTIRCELTRGSGQTMLVLPGTVQAITEAAVLARADGYLKRRLVDLGILVVPRARR